MKFQMMRRMKMPSLRNAGRKDRLFWRYAAVKGISSIEMIITVAITVIIIQWSSDVRIILFLMKTTLIKDHPSLKTTFSVTCACFCLYGLFNCISFLKFS